MNEKGKQTNTGRTHIKKGQRLSPKTEFQKGVKQTKEQIEKRISKIREEKHYKWKGDDVGYGSLHQWVRKHLGEPRFCEECGNRNLNHRQYHWANISRNYKRIITDWRRLCVKCHKKFDKANGRWKNSTGRPRKS